MEMVMSVGRAYCFTAAEQGNIVATFGDTFLLLLLEWRFAKMLPLTFQYLSVYLPAELPERKNQFS